MIALVMDLQLRRLLHRLLALQLGVQRRLLRLPRLQRLHRLHHLQRPDRECQRLLCHLRRWISRGKDHRLCLQLPKSRARMRWKISWMRKLNERDKNFDVLDRLKDQMLEKFRCIRS